MTFTNALLWLLVIAILLVAADAIRRIWKERSRLHIRIDPSLHNLPEPSNTELPNGGARIVKRAPRVPMEQMPLTPAAPPLMMDADDDEPKVSLSPAASAAVNAEPDRDDLSSTSSMATSSPAESAISNERTASAERTQTPPVAVTRSQQSGVESVTQDPAMRHSASKPQAAAPEMSLRPPEKTVEKAAENAPAKTSAEPLLEVLVVSLLFTQSVSGERLLQSLVQQGLRFGEMRIFHAHENGKLLFSMANAHEPGYFNINAMEREQLRAVSFFMKLPGPAEPLMALNRMLSTAQYLAQELDGELHDERRSLLTHQMMEHMRERVREFERRMRVPDVR